MQKVKFNFSLGDYVKDTISEFEGVVVSLSYFVNGCKRVEVIPKVTFGGLETGLVLDEQCLELIKPSIFSNLKEFEYQHEFLSLVKDVFTEVQGKISGVHFRSNGTYYRITLKSHSKPLEDEIFSSERIVLLEAPVKKATPAKSTGGPSEKSRFVF